MMFRLIIMLLCPAFFLLLQPGAYAATRLHSPEIEALLVELDSLLAESPQINQAKEIRLASLRSSYARKTDNEHRYWLASTLYDEYAAYDSDSAMAYADRAKEIAIAMNRPDLVADMELNRAYVFSATGLLDEAMKCLRGIDESKLSQEQMLKYCDRMLFLSSHRDLYIGENDRDTAYPEYVDSLITTSLQGLSSSDRYYCWIVGWGHLKDKEQAELGIKVVQPIVEESKFRTRDDALNAPGWAQLPDPEYSFDGETLSLKLPTATNERWQAQVKLHTDIAIPDVAVTYDFKIVLESNVDHPGVTVKLVQSDESADVKHDNNFFFAEKVALKAGAPTKFWVAAAKAPEAMHAVSLVLDFGGCADGTEVNVSDITLQVHHD